MNVFFSTELLLLPSLLPVFVFAVSLDTLPGLLFGLVIRRVIGTREGRLEILRRLLIGYGVGTLIVPLKTGSLIYDVLLMVMSFVVLMSLLPPSSARRAVPSRIAAYPLRRTRVCRP